MNDTWSRGRSDEPSTRDLLEVKPYVRGLTDFAETCGTPLTIAIQGGWGTGKTTVLRLMREQLQDTEQTIVVEFDAWQAAFASGEEDVVVHLVRQITDEVSSDQPDSSPVHRSAVKLRNLLTRWTPTAGAVAVRALAAAFAAKMGGNSNALGMAMAQATNEVAAHLPDAPSAPHQDVPEITGESVRGYFHELIEQRFGDSQLDASSRLLVIIDNLDRLRPSRAVEVMECLKAVLDAPHCVFVVAVDFDVVLLGVQDKYKSLGDARARDFFDKIIQLPFQLPVTNYNISPLVRDLLYEIAEDEAQRVEALVRASAGTTPRSIKRLVNAYRLLRKIQFAKSGVPEDDRGVDLRVLSIVGLQVGFPVVYEYFDRNGLDLLAEALEVSSQAQKRGTDTRGLQALLHTWQPGDDEDELKLLSPPPESMSGAAALLAHMADLFTEGRTISEALLRESWELSNVTAAATPDPKVEAEARTRRPKSSLILVESGTIPEGAEIEMVLEGRVREETAQQIYKWLDEVPARRRVTWTNDRIRPLVWAQDPGVKWTFSSLRNEIFERAGVPPHGFSAADLWCYHGTSMYLLAEEALSQQQWNG